MGRNETGDKLRGTGVTPISSSSYEIFFSFQGIKCRERIKAKPSEANTRALLKFRQQILLAIENGTFNYAETFPHSKRRHLFRRSGALTYGEYLEDWLKIKKTQLAASTYYDYERIAMLITGQFGNVPLADIRKGMLKAWLATIERSNKRLSNIQIVLRSSLGDALDDELIESNPMAGYTFRRNEPPRERDHADPLTADEQQALLDACKEPQVRNLFQFAFWTGMRTSELIALEWKDVDFIRGSVRVQRAITKRAKGQAEDTKTVAGRRDVKLLAPALAALEAQKPHTFMLAGRIFHRPGHTGWTGDTQVWDAWGIAIRRAGIRYRNPYQTRHTYASMMLSAGESEMWVAQQMGHANTASIRKNYGRWIAADDDAGGKAVAMFGGVNDNRRRSTKSVT